MDNLNKFKSFMKRVIENIEEIGSNHVIQYDLEMYLFDKIHDVVEEDDNDEE